MHLHLIFGLSNDFLCSNLETGEKYNVFLDVLVLHYLDFRTVVFILFLFYLPVLHT